MKNSKIALTRRVMGIETSPTLMVLNRAKDLAAQGIDVVDFGPGEPDFSTPPSVAAAGKRAIDEGYTKYTNALGCNELRKAIADRYASRYGIHLGCEHIIAGTGGKQELFNVMLALVEEGDEVVIPSPYWVSFPDQVKFAGGKPVFAPSDPARNFRPSIAEIEPAVTAHTRGIILNSPCNPTGAVIDERDLEEIIEFAAARNLFLVFDETYEFFVYEGRKHASAARWFDRFPETIVVVNSMSKTYAMTGWRLGYAIAHPEIIDAVGKIQSHSTSNPSSISQRAAMEALRGGEEEVRKMYEAYADRRQWLMGALNEIDGFECQPPDGAFYAFPRVNALYTSGFSGSTEFANFLLEQAAVAVVPGDAFGADDYIRLSYATSLDRIKEGVSRMARAVQKLRAIR